MQTCWVSLQVFSSLIDAACHGPTPCMRGTQFKQHSIYITCIYIVHVHVDQYAHKHVDQVHILHNCAGSCVYIVQKHPYKNCTSCQFSISASLLSALPDIHVHVSLAIYTCSNMYIIRANTIGITCINNPGNYSRHFIASLENC